MSFSKAALEQAINEATTVVQNREEKFVEARARLAQAQHELRLLLELAKLRGLTIEQVPRTAMGDLGVPDNGSPAEKGGRMASTSKAALLDAVVDILGERGEPIQIQELMAAVKERGVAIPGSGQQANLIAHITRDDRIVRPRRGFYALRDWGVEDAARSKRGKRRRSRSGAAT